MLRCQNCETLFDSGLSACPNCGEDEYFTMIDKCCENCKYGSYDREGFYCEFHERDIEEPDIEYCKAYECGEYLYDEEEY